MLEHGEALDTLKTLRDLMRFAVSRFTENSLVFGHGTSNAWDEAAYLLTHTLHLPHDYFEHVLDARLLPKEIESALNVIKTRTQKRLPVAYITHEAWLGNFSFYVDERVIVPRSFIAEIINDPPGFLQPQQEFKRIADICTGSGCLAVLLACQFPEAHVDAVDISVEALTVANLNIESYGLSKRITLHEGNMLAPLKGKYNLIVCNPPYVNAQGMKTLPPEYQREPSIALESGTDGLEHVKILLDNAPNYLTKNGLILLEIGHNRAEFCMTWPRLEVTWLDTVSGDEYVCLIEANALKT